jgi:hypothetical protein
MGSSLSCKHGSGYESFFRNDELNRFSGDDPVRGNVSSQYVGGHGSRHKGGLLVFPHAREGRQ